MHLLNEGSYNYNIFLQSYSVRRPSRGSSEQLVRMALGDEAVVGKIDAVTPEDMQAQVASSIAYVGDSGSGPRLEGLNSQRLKDLLAALLADLAQASSQATKVEQFWLEAGHPHYPVFWDFAFILTSAKEASILIGSSSD